MSLTKIQNTVLQNPYRRNLIINGAMQIWQRGTALAGITGTTSNFLPDRFSLETGSLTGTMGYRQIGSPPADAPFIHSPLQAYCSATGTASWAAILYSIEGYDFNYIKGKSCVLSFWAWTNNPGTYHVAFRGTSNNYSYVVPYTMPSNIWTYVVIPVTFPSSGITFGSTNDRGVNICWNLASGSSTSTFNTWLSGNYYSGPNQANLLSAINNAFYMMGVQLEVGSQPTPFELRTLNKEGNLCKRYYEKSYNMFTAPGTITANGCALEYLTVGGASTIGTGGADVKFAVEKCYTPTVTIYSPDTGTAGKVRSWANNTDYNAGTPTVGTTGFYWYGTVNVATTLSMVCNWTASCEIS